MSMPDDLQLPRPVMGIGSEQHGGVIDPTAHHERACAEGLPRPTIWDFE